MLIKLKIFMDSGQTLEEVVDWPTAQIVPLPEDIGLAMLENHGIRTEDGGWLYVDDQAIDAIVIHPVVSHGATIGSAKCDCHSPVVVLRVKNSNLFESECSYCGHMLRVREDEVTFDDGNRHGE